VYTAILEPIWTNGVQLGGSASNCNIKILERFQSKVLSIITVPLRYVPNVVIKRDLKVLSAKQAVHNCSVTYRQRLDDHATDWQNLYFKKHITNVGLSGITLHI
jgi:hypothetical protein